MSIFDEDQKSMLDVYLYETNSLFEQLDTILMKNEKNSSFTKEEIHSIFRIMHTTKSSSSMMGLQGISTLMHTVEDLFSLFRDDLQRLKGHEQETFDLLFNITDFMHLQLEHMGKDDYVPGNPNDFIMKTQGLLAKIDQLEDGNATNNKETAIKQTELADKGVCIKITFEKEARMENVRAYMIIMQIKGLCHRLEYYPQTLEDNPKAAQFIKDNGFYLMFEADDSKKVIESLHRSLFLKKCEIIDKNDYLIYTQSRKSIKKEVGDDSNESSSIIPVHVSKLNALQNLIGELMISESKMINRMEELGQKELLELFERNFHKLLLDTEEIIMSSRLVPIAQIVPKLNRVVRDIARKEEKEINFIIKGEDIEIDKEIVDSLFNPLMHLLRNAVDHGIESKQERLKYHKPEIGEIILTVQNINGEIVIHISDDGRGLDIDKIKEKAITAGLIEGDYPYTQEEIFNFIMLPGFSTNHQANEFSGRGVGMDVVKNMIDRFKGHISIDSEFHKGTFITLHLPLTLTIIESLLFKVGETTLSVAASNVNQFFAFDNNVQEDNGHYIYLYEDKIIPIIDLTKHFNFVNQISTSSKILIHVKTSSNEACLLADQIIGYQHIVDKPLPLLLNSEFKKYTAISGCSLLGDGHICMTLNMELLLNGRGEGNE